MKGMFGVSIAPQKGAMGWTESPNKGALGLGREGWGLGVVVSPEGCVGLRVSQQHG
ncbi:hypothetical protein Tco_1198080, partial [Tanacetum coccineum]